MPARRGLVPLSAVVALLAACASPTPSGSWTDGPPVVDPSAAPSSTGPVATFTACGREAPAASSTNLRPSALTDADRAAVAGWAGGPVPDGRLVLEHAAALPLPAGLLGFGNGYEASTGALRDDVLRELAPAGTTADVTLAVLDSPSVGRRVAFVEVHLADGTPVRWREEPALGFGTDGGDGGVYAPAYRGAPAASDDAAFDAIEAVFPDGDASAGHVCAVRSTENGVDAVVFSAGYGDGGYPTFLGYDADDEVVSAVSYGFVLPWALSGLPGTPPSDADL
ncbi:DUF4241 domain-containing protein [Cellulomonas fimi]|uniref:DUF4241 domain-containing protein n=1 Tax=Cellulomonas fimi TaxID=1708 RepID=UPI00234C4CEE|nr:DUF4241 domain-containing protein [Cellulomonas fimi]MDC7122664.1 DUF4241 domain-containing protein [Cellulomonas fimi]